MANQPIDGYGGGYQPKGTGGKKPAPPPRDPNKTAGQLEEVVVEINKGEAQRVIAWFGSVTMAQPGDFELAARIRRAFE